MSQITFRVNLSAATFPTLSENMGRTIIYKQYDQNYIPAITPKEDADKDIGIPQILYCHNVMSTPSGYQSVGYTAQIPPIEGKNFSQVVLVRDSDTNKFIYLAFCEGGEVYLSYPDFTVWTYVTTLINSPGTSITTANINGETYIYIAKYGCYKYNFTLGVLEEITLQGLVKEHILGILASGSYLISYGVDAVYWSSLIDPTDFIPSQITGAGGGQIQEARGDIVFAVPTGTGFFVYTVQNIVVAVESGNASYPFNFRGFTSSGGITGTELVSYGEVSTQYAYTSHGLMAVTALDVKPIFTEISDFISGDIFEDFNEVTNQFELTSIPFGTMKKRISFVSGRYLVISYGIIELTHALVYDVGLKKWGKLKITHVDCFTFDIQLSSKIIQPRKSIAFLTKSGEIKLVNFSSRDGSIYGVAILGKYQFSRSRLTQLNEVTVENVPIVPPPRQPNFIDPIPTNLPDNASEEYIPFRLYILPSLDGTNFDSKVEPYWIMDRANLKEYRCRVIAENFSLLFKGLFNLSTITLNLSINGKR